MAPARTAASGPRTVNPAAAASVRRRGAGAARQRQPRGTRRLAGTSLRSRWPPRTQGIVTAAVLGVARSSTQPVPTTDRPVVGLGPGGGCSAAGTATAACRSQQTRLGVDCGNASTRAQKQFPDFDRAPRKPSFPRVCCSHRQKFVSPPFACEGWGCGMSDTTAAPMFAQSDVDALHRRSVRASGAISGSPQGSRELSPFLEAATKVRGREGEKTPCSPPVSPKPSQSTWRVALAPTAQEPFPAGGACSTRGKGRRSRGR